MVRRSLKLVSLVLLAGLPVSPLFAQDPTDEQEAATEVERTAAFAALAQEAEALERYSNLLKKAVKLASPSVVHIDTEIERQMPLAARRGQIEEAGSGFIVDVGGKYYTITNRHVVKLAALDDIRITLADGRQINPTRVWSDPETDIAVLAITAPRLFPARIGDSNALEIGDFVMAMGSPFGLSHSVTFGIVSAKGRRDLELGDDVRFQDFLQTDAAINPGNSGGPLANLRAEVIGMNTAIASNSGGSEGIGFAIPINMVMVIARQLIERGTVERAFMGVALDSKFGPAVAMAVGLSRPRGARITRVTPGSPAEHAKLQPGDIILRYNGVRIDNDSHLINLVSLTEVGKMVVLEIFRDRQRLEVPVTLAKAPARTE